LIADRIDFANFKASVPFLLTGHLARSAAAAPHIFFLQTEDRKQNFDSDRGNFLKWSAQMMGRFGLTKKVIQRRVNGAYPGLNAGCLEAYRPAFYAG
jgi:hypothetical protein